MCVSGQAGPVGFPGQRGQTGATGATGPTVVNRRKRQAGCPGKLSVYSAVMSISILFASA